MSKEFITEFIDVYRQHPALWKIKSPEYINKNLKNVEFTALTEVCKRFKMKADRDCVKKIQSLRSTFRKEYKKMENSRRSGKGIEEIYFPNLWYFDLLMFIKDQEQPTQSMSNMASPSARSVTSPAASVQEDEEEEEDYVNNSDATEADNSHQEEAETENESQVASQSSSEATAHNINTACITNERQKRKRQKKDEQHEHRDFLKACTTALSSGSHHNISDDSDAFGAYVGKKLKCVTTPEQKMYAEALITQVLQRAVMNKLTEATTLTDQQMPFFFANPRNDASNNVSSVNSDESSSVQQYYSHFTQM